MQSSAGGSLHLDHHDRRQDDDHDDHGAHDGQDGEVELGLLEVALLFTRYTPCRPSR